MAKLSPSRQASLVRNFEIPILLEPNLTCSPASTAERANCDERATNSEYRHGEANENYRMFRPYKNLLALVPPNQKPVACCRHVSGHSKRQCRANKMRTVRPVEWKEHARSLR